MPRQKEASFLVSIIHWSAISDIAFILSFATLSYFFSQWPYQLQFGSFPRIGWLLNELKTVRYMYWKNTNGVNIFRKLVLQTGCNHVTLLMTYQEPINFHIEMIIFICPSQPLDPLLATIKVFNLARGKKDLLLKVYKKIKGKTINWCSVISLFTSHS